MNTLAARRRHPAAIVVLLLLGLVVTGGLYAVLAPKTAHAATAGADDVASGHALFLANCATCHGLHAEGRKAGPNTTGPSLVGVGAGAVDFQVGTGRMPLAAPGVQAQSSDKVRFTDQQISQLAAYVGSLGPGPGIPEAQYTNGQGDIGRGGELFRVNCAMCHNSVGAGGALSRGKYAPSLRGVDGKYIFEAMESGPQSMPVFNDANLSPTDKGDIISYVHALDTEPHPGGWDLGRLGPVPEGLLAWTVGIGLAIGCAIWLGSKSA